MLDFVRDVRPLYVECNLVIVPTTVSAGTNLKVLEAMAMERAVVSTSCGCAGLGLKHGASVSIADDADSFARKPSRVCWKTRRNAPAWPALPNRLSCNSIGRHSAANSGSYTGSSSEVSRSHNN